MLEHNDNATEPKLVSPNNQLSIVRSQHKAEFLVRVSPTSH